MRTWVSRETATSNLREHVRKHEETRREAPGADVRSDLLQEYGVKIRFIGRRDMLPPDVREAVDDMERMTEGNKG